MNHFYGPRCVWTIVATAAIISCHSHNVECQCTAATFAMSASMFQGEKMMTSLLTVMITFGTQAVGKLGKRLSGWQPLSVSCCHRERANARTSDASLHATLHLTAASAAQEPERSQEGKVMGNVLFEMSCHVRDSDKVRNGMQAHAWRHVLETWTLRQGVCRSIIC